MIAPELPIKPTHGRTTKGIHMATTYTRKPGILIEYSGTCSVCGKSTSRKVRIDPKRDDGSQKTLQEIAAEEAVIRTSPVVHVGCGNKEGTDQ